MADKKISALTPATTPLAGTEVLPIVQSGATVKVAVSDLTTGRAINALSVTSPNTEGAVSFTGSGAFVGRGTAFAAGQAELYTAGTRPLGIGTTGASNLNFYTGSIRAFYVDTNQNFVPVTAAKGVNFTANTPAAGMTSQLLNDYQEGTWTPAFVNGTFTYGFQSGFYTKVGRLVTVSALVTWSAKTGAGNLSITLPFTIRPSNYYRGGISLGNCNGLILNAGFTVIGSLDQSATSTDFYFLVSNAAAQQMTLNDIGSSGAIQFTATYMV